MIARETAQPMTTPTTTSSATRVPLYAILLLAFLAIFWGLNWPVMKIGLTEVSPWVFRSCASISGALGLFAIAKIAGHSLRVPREQRVGLVICALLNLTFWNILVLYGIDLMQAGRAAILGYTMPIWATLAGTYMLREKLSLRALIALTFGMAGMGLLFFAEGQALGNSLLGPLLVVGAAICWGVGTALTKYYAFTMPITVSTAWQHVIGVTPIVIGALLTDLTDHGPVSLWPALMVAYNMIITSIFCYWAYFKVVQLLPVVVSTVGMLAVPVLGVFFDALIFQNQPTWFDYGALLAVVAAVYLVMTVKR
jgi:drug/metabolite transporter (DMT)-like permease